MVKYEDPQAGTTWRLERPGWLEQSKKEAEELEM